MLPAENNNRKVLEQLQALLAGGKAVHAFLFTGDKAARLPVGRALAKAILCEDPRNGAACGDCPSCRKFDHGNHEDFLYLDLETAPGNARTQIGVDGVEILQEQLKLKPFGRRHVAMIEEAHLLNTAAQNKLLKTLEEPAGDSVLILLAEKREELLPTVLSRCSIYHLEESAAAADPEILATARAFFALCAEGALFYRRRDCLRSILDEKADPREKGLNFLLALENICRDALLALCKAENGSLQADWPLFEELCAKMDLPALKREIEAVEEANRCLRLGYNVGYTLKKMCLNI